MRELFPDGIEDVTDLPHTLFTALRLGLTFLQFEELPEDEQPPRNIWLHGEKLKDWFATVKKRRDEKYGKDGKKAIEDPQDNDAAGALISG